MNNTANTTKTPATKYGFLGEGSSRFAEVIAFRFHEVDAYSGTSYWVPETWNGNMNHRIHEGAARLADTVEGAEAALAAARENFTNASGTEQARMSGRKYND